MLTGEQLSRIMPNLPLARRDLYLPFLARAMEECAINTGLREAAFLAQLAHESCELRYMEEIASGQAYEGRRDLGNTHPGDGRRYKGRGPIQLTGRANYQRFGKLLGVDLVNHPELAATPEVGFRVAGLFWKNRGLNELADAGNFTEITRRINGGQRGAAQRRTYYERAMSVLCAAAPPQQPHPAIPEPDEQPPQPKPTKKALRMVVNGVEVPGARPYLDEGHLMVALRPVANAAGLCIVKAAGGHALVRDRSNVDHEIALHVRGKTGYVALRDLPGVVNWDGATSTGELKT